MTESEEEKGYEIKDKRRVKLDENGEVHVQSEDARASEKPEAKAAESEAGESEPAEPEGIDLPSADVYSLLKTFISVLGMNTWHWMGLMRNPVTGELDKDLTQAKVAIDSIAAMVNLLESKTDPSELRELRNLVSDLRINFVQQSAKQP